VATRKINFSPRQVLISRRACVYIYEALIYFSVKENILQLRQLMQILKNRLKTRVFNKRQRYNLVIIAQVSSQIKLFNDRIGTDFRTFLHLSSLLER